MLADGHQVRQNLAGMAEVGQTVDDRDRAVLRQVLDLLLCIGADHDAVQIAGQNARGILHRLAAADLQVTVGQEQRLTAELIHAGFEGDAGAGGGLLEDHAEALALQMAVGDIMLLFIFELVGQIEQADDLLGGADRAA